MHTENLKPLIVANWKMNKGISDAIKWVTAVKNAQPKVTGVDLVVAPSFTALYSVAVALSETNFGLAAQNLHWEDEGAFTGEVSGQQLKEVGCGFAILGHSERRQYFGETDRTVNAKIQAALKSDLVPIVCLGENLEQREGGQTLAVVEKQLKVLFQEIAVHDFDAMVVAYEPIWAIGTGKNATPEQAEEVHHCIRGWLRRYFDAPVANRIRLLYGGSVKPDNAAALMRQPNVDGLLVGGASLDAEALVKILQFQERLS